MRILLYTGKGGVGKTTLSAMTGVRSAELGKRVVVISTDAAHSLADAFDRHLGDQPTEIMENLWGIEIDVNKELAANWADIQRYTTDFLRQRGFDQVIAEELAVLPGMEELFCLMRLKEYYEKETFDLAVIDCAPTASTIRMLSFPDVISWYMDRFFHIERKIMKAVRPIAERIAKVPLPRDDVYLAVERIYKKLHGLKEILTDPLVSSIRLVFNPEKMVIKESQRAMTYLALFGYPVDSVYANRLYPEQIQDPYFKEWHSIQMGHLDAARESFHPLPIFNIRLFQKEIIGTKLLGQLAREVFDDKDPSEVFFRDRPIEVKKEGDGYVLELFLPFAERSEIDLWTSGDELVIKVKNFKRNLSLPRTLTALEIKSARFEAGRFRITFGE